ncbi:hypothetical protein MAR_012720 [Mya arenaria]|uniref:Uncharacterized protein n=1 Tax=Mya arenaria TaxID=6604 RepID=A0ABY7G1S5_MYAAR|nr:hypothetical protein MAR_012720 [Mya arenaria]
MVVGSFIVPSESSYNIGRGLQVLKAWNPSWNPTYFMTDYDRKEINAIENTFPDAVQLLWDLPRDFDIPVAKVYGTTVTDTDIRSLQSPEWLTDNIIDAYLHMLCVELTGGKVGRMLNIDSISMNAIMNKTFRPRNPPNIYEYMFVILDVEEKKVFFYNPIQAVEFAEKHMTGAADSLVHITLADLNIMRRKVAKKVMVFEVFLTGCCPKCGMTVDDDLETDSVSRGPKKPVSPKLLAEKTPTCCLCTEPHDERLHPGCIGRDPDETPADSSTAFWCEACLTAVVKVWPVDNCKEFIESGGLSDDEGYIIDASVVLSLMHAGYSRCWLIIHAQGTKSPEEIYSKHHIIDGIENKEFANLFNEEFGTLLSVIRRWIQD